MLLASENLKLQGLAEILGHRDSFVGAAAKTAIESRVACIGMHIDPRQTAKGDAEHLVQRVVLIPGSIAQSQVGAEPYMLVDFDAGACAEALHQIFVEQPGLDQTRIKRGEITEVSVVETEFDARVWLDANGCKAATHAESRAGLAGGGPLRSLIVISRLRIDLRGLIDRENA